MNPIELLFVVDWCYILFYLQQNGWNQAETECDDSLLGNADFRNRRKIHG